MAVSRPGVYVQESVLQQTNTLNDRSDAVGVLIGALPIGPTAPTLIRSWPEFVKFFGGLNYSYPTSIAAKLFFSNGGRDAYIRRVTHSDADTAQVNIVDEDGAATAVAVASSPGSWANSTGSFPIAIEVTAGGSEGRFNVIVYGPPPTAAADIRSNILEQFSDLSMSPSDSRYAVAVVNAFSNYFILTDSETGNAPSTTEGLKHPTGGADGSAVTRTDLLGAHTDFDNIRTPLLMNLPDTQTFTFNEGAGANADLLSYAEARGDAFVIIDSPAGAPVSGVTGVTAYSTQCVSSATGANGAIYYPWLSIPDTSKAIPGILINVAPGGAVMGQYQDTDVSRGVFKTPAGYNNRLNGVVALERVLTNSELDALNSAANPVNAIRVAPGAGIVIMGGRTLSVASSNRYINMRRSLIYVKKEVTDRTSFAVFENNDSILWTKINAKLVNFLKNYWSQGGLKGASPSEAFFVRCDSSNNTPSEIAQGKVNIEIGLALEYPAEFVIINIGQLSSTATA
ncbi:MAG: phage tail sheath family protein [Fluviibacter sp.]